jgi:cell division protein ZapA (FtsZ GTPase activity inhibitor)
MAELTLRINGYPYTVACEDGQEPHLRAMGQALEDRVESIKALGTQSGESKLLVLAGLLMADELHDLRAEPAPATDPRRQDEPPVRPNHQPPCRSRRTDCNCPGAALSSLGGAAGRVRYYIPWADRQLPGAGSVMALVMVTGAHLHKQALGG